jgi:hypothetical protein
MPSVVAAQGEYYVFNYEIPALTTQSTNTFFMHENDNISIFVTVVGEIKIMIDDASTQDVFTWEDMQTGTYFVNHTFIESGSFYLDFYNLLTEETSFVNGSYYLNLNITSITNVTYPTEPGYPTYPTDGTYPTYITYPTGPVIPSDSFRFLFWNISINYLLGIGTGVFVTFFCLFCKKRIEEEDLSHLLQVKDGELFPSGSMRDDVNINE